MKTIYKQNLLTAALTVVLSAASHPLSAQTALNDPGWQAVNKPTSQSASSATKPATATTTAHPLSASSAPRESMEYQGAAVWQPASPANQPVSVRGRV